MLYIHGIGHCHPDNVISNAFLEELDIGTNPKWIVDRVGIRERRTVLPLDYIRETLNKDPVAALKQVEYTTATAGVRATEMALARANLDIEQIGMVVGGSSSPRYSVPAEVCSIAGELGINVPAYDINSGCATFTVHLHLMNQMQTQSSPDYILMLIPDHITRSIDFSDRRSAILFGDCTTAVIVSKKIPSRFRVNFTSMDSAPCDWRKVQIPTGGHVQLEGAAVQKFAIKKTIQTLKNIAKHTNYNPEKDYFIGHQANLRMLEFVCESLQIPQERHLYNADLFGNCGGASAPSVFSQQWERFQKDDKMAIVVVGAGLTWGGLSIEVS
jgi:3-oxoacyl-[acyl-carrier-protein] synthase III